MFRPHYRIGTNARRPLLGGDTIHGTPGYAGAFGNAAAIAAASGWGADLASARGATDATPGAGAAGIALSGTITVGILLSDPTTQNPATVAAAAYVTNTTTAGHGDAIYGDNIAAWTVANFGTIAGSPTRSSAGGIMLAAGGLVINGQSGSSAGLISAQSNAVAIRGGSGTVINYGTIASVSGVGVQLLSDGTVVNAPGGMIAGKGNGVSASFGGVAIVNSGAIQATGSSSTGIFIAATGNNIRNLPGGLISGVRDGVSVGYRSGATIVNSGTIVGSGTNGDGINLAGLTNVSIDNGPSGWILGGAVGIASTGLAGTVNNLGLIQGSGSGIIAYANTQITNFGTIGGAAGVTVHSTTLTSFGTIGGMSDTDTVVNYGTIIGTAGSGVELNGPATLIDLGRIAGSSTAVAFGYGGGELLVIGTAATFDGLVASFHSSDTIDLLGVVANGSTYQGGVLSLTENNAVVAQLALSTPTHNPQFVLTPDGAGGTAIIVAPGNPASYYNEVIRDGIVLIEPASQNPTTIGPAGYVTRLDTAYFGAGLYGTPAAAWAVDNFGTIAGNPTLSTADAVRLLAGGSVTNGQADAPGGLVTATANGIAIGGAAGAVANYGTIVGASAGGKAGDGVDLTNGGIVVNGARDVTSAVITGAGGIAIHGAAGTVVNYATIASTGTQYGVAVGVGSIIDNFGTILNGIYIPGALDNAPGALIAGTVNDKSGTIQNFGSFRDGLDLSYGANLYNATGAVISSSSIGVFNIGAGPSVATVTNFGTISAASQGVNVESNSAVYVYNSSDGLILGTLGGVAIGFLYAFSAIDNFGTIVATGAHGTGVLLAAAQNGAGSLTNQPGALIEGNNGVQLGSNFGTVDNSGTIVAFGTHGIGIYLVAGTISNYGLVEAGPSGFGVRQQSGTVTNSGTVVAGAGGIGIGLYSGYVKNYGTILAPGATAVIVRHGEFVNDGLVEGQVLGIELSGTAGSPVVTVSGTVIGATGISAASAVGTSQTVSVGGMVVGTSGTAVSLTAGGDDRLILDPGAAFEGVVDGGGGASVLEIATGLAGPAAALLRAFGGVAYVGLGNITNFSSLEIDPSAAAEAAGALAFDTLVNQGQINIGAGDSVSFGTVASAAYAGLIALRGGGAVDFAGAVGNQNIAFGPPGGTATIDQPAAFTAAISGFAVGDTLDLAGSASDPHYAGGVLSLLYNGSPLALAIATPYTVPLFRLSPDGAGGTDISVMPGAAIPNDFFGTGTSDILWQDTAGDVAIWQMAGAAITANPLIGAAPANWHIAGAGDFNGDGAADILWQDSAGDVAIWEMAGGTVIANPLVASGVPADWHIAGTGDFNGDGNSDILWQDNAGDVAIWEMNGAAIVANPLVATVPSNWHIAGTGDFNGDGNSDILWQDTSGDVAIWQMNGGSVIANPVVATVPSNWHIAGTGDFNGDGMSDILWQDSAGDVAIWQMNGGTIVANPLVATVPSNWHIAGTGDYNGDGMSDILWQDTAGDVAIWEMAGGTVIANPIVASGVPANWQIQSPATPGGASAAASFSFADVSAAAPVGTATAATGGGLPASPSGSSLPPLAAATPPPSADATLQHASLG